MLLSRTFTAVLVTIVVLSTTGSVHGRETSIRDEMTTTTTTTKRALMGKGPRGKSKQKDDDSVILLDDTNLDNLYVSPCDQYDDRRTMALCESFCNSDCYMDVDNTMMEPLAVHHHSGISSDDDDGARNSTKTTGKSKTKKTSKSSSDDGGALLDLSCTELRSEFRDITGGDDFPCLRCPCWTKKTLWDTFADYDLITDDSCYDYLPGPNSQIYLSDNVSFVLAQDDIDGLFGNSTHYCLTDTIGPMTIDEKTARICVETLTSYCDMIGTPVEEYDLPPI